MVGVAAVGDLEHHDGGRGVVDLIDDSVLATPGAPFAVEWRTQLFPYPVRVVQEWAVDELESGCGDSLREGLSQGARGAAGNWRR